MVLTYTAYKKIFYYKTFRIDKFDKIFPKCFDENASIKKEAILSFDNNNFNEGLESKYIKLKS